MLREHREINAAQNCSLQIALKFFRFSKHSQKKNPHVLLILVKAIYSQVPILTGIFVRSLLSCLFLFGFLRPYLGKAYKSKGKSSCVLSEHSVGCLPLQCSVFLGPVVSNTGFIVLHSNVDKRYAPKEKSTGAIICFLSQ